MNELVTKLTIQLTILGRDKQYVDDYEKLKTDQERLIFAFNTMLENNIILKATGTQKNAEVSEKLCKEGDALFSQVPLDNIMCIKALELYTKSIALAPYASQQLGLAYANRSAVLFRLGLHLECTQDIDRALLLNYPDNLKAKIHIRRTECSIILGKSSVENDIKEAQHWLEMMSLNVANRKKLRKELDSLYHKIKAGGQVEPEETEIDVLPTIIQSYSNEIPCASDAITVKYNERYGRHIAATRDIRPGEVLAIEKPYSVMMSPERLYTHCSNCLKLCWSNIPCNYCGYAMYCSEECKDVAWRKYHDVECAVLSILIEYGFHITHLFSLKLAIYAVREAGSIRELKTKLDEIDNCDDPRTKGFSQDGKFYSDKYISLYSLVTNTEKRTVPDLLRDSLDVCVILYFLATQTMFFGTKLPEDIDALMKNNDAIFFARLILRNRQIIPCNRHYFTETFCSEIRYRGLTAMPFHSLINHSCDPNVFKCPRSEDIMLYAIHPIKKDEQILASYGQHYALALKTARQQELLRKYHFTCDCLPCQENWPCRSELKSYKNLVKEASHKSKVKKALNKLDIYMGLMMEDEVQNKSNIVKNLLNMIEVLYDYVPMPCIEILDIFETLNDIYLLKINTFKMPKLWPYEK